MKRKIEDIEWLPEPEEHDYPAAASYLSLMFDDKTTQRFVEQLRKAPMTEFKAKDIFRASRLGLLSVTNLHVAKNEKKVKKGKALSPLLLVRHTSSGTVIIADGYHRLCTVYAISEDAVIPAKIV